MQSAHRYVSAECRCIMLDSATYYKTAKYRRWAKSYANRFAICDDARNAKFAIVQSVWYLSVVGH